MFAECLNDPARLKKVGIEQKLPLEYFMNKLYVACSRARRRLFILDRPNAIQQLWGFAINDDGLDKLCGNLCQANDEWRDSVGHVVRGIPEYWEDNRNDPLEMATKFEAEGDSDRDPYLLRQAAHLFEQADDSPRAMACHGRACEYQGKFKRAGEFFVQASDLKRALGCFWEAAACVDIVSLGDKNPSLSTGVEFRLASFLCDSQPVVDDALELLGEVARLAVETPEFRIKLRSNSWLKGVKTLESRASAAIERTSDSSQWTHLVNTHDSLLAFGLTIDVEQRAKALYCAERYEQVIQLLDARRKLPLYRRAKTIVLQKQKEAGHEEKIGTDDRRFAGDVLRGEGKADEAIWWYRTSQHIPGLKQCFETIAENGHTQAAVKCVCSLAEVFVHQGLWSDIAALLDADGWQGLSRNDKRFLRDSVSQADLMETVLLQPIAVSDSIVRIPGMTLKKIYPHLEILLPAETALDSVADERKLRTLGAAVERVGLDISALAYYEGLSKLQGISSTLREYVNRRWIRCKLRRESRERSGKRVNADKYREEIESRLRKYNWKRSDVGPDYPDRRMIETDGTDQVVPKPPHDGDVVAAGSANSKWQMGSLACAFFEMTDRINIQSNVGEQARVDFAARVVRSDDVDIVCQNRDSWAIPSWNLEVKFESDQVTVVFRMGTKLIRKVVRAKTPIHVDEGSNHE